MGNYLLDESSPLPEDGDEFIRCTASPWELNPRSPLSWWDMLAFSARSFFWIGHALEHLSNDCLIASSIHPGDEPEYQMFAPLDGRTIGKANTALDAIIAECNNINLAISAKTAAEMKEILADPSQSNNTQWFMDQVRAIKKLIEKEMKGKVFIYMTPERVRFLPTYPNPFIFGKEVHDSFPSVQYDCMEAACSLAFLRPTASVFHLMRIMEIALGALGAVFSVSLAHTKPIGHLR